MLRGISHPPVSSTSCSALGFTASTMQVRKSVVTEEPRSSAEKCFVFVRPIKYTN